MCLDTFHKIDAVVKNLKKPQFWLHFGIILASVLIHFGSICFPGGDMGTGSRNMHEMSRFWGPLGLHLGSIFHEKTVQKSVTFFIHFFIDFCIDLGAQNASQNRSKINQKSVENWSKKSSIFRSILAWISQRFLLDFPMHF